MGQCKGGTNVTAGAKRVEVEELWHEFCGKIANPPIM